MRKKEKRLCDTCLFYYWYYDWCDKWKYEVVWNGVWNCWESRDENKERETE